MHTFEFMGITAEISTYNFRWYWRHKWNWILIALHVRPKPEPDPIATTWSAASVDALRTSAVFSRLIDQSFSADVHVGDTIHIPSRTRD
jgi:hypothetical protein